MRMRLVSGTMLVLPPKSLKSTKTSSYHNICTLLSPNFAQFNFRALLSLILAHVFCAKITVTRNLGKVKADLHLSARSTRPGENVSAHAQLVRSFSTRVRGFSQNYSLEASHLKIKFGANAGG